LLPFRGRTQSITADIFPEPDASPLIGVLPAMYADILQNVEEASAATGTKVETKHVFTDYLEKAETGAVGRALAVSGYVAQFAPELEERGRLVDARSRVWRWAPVRCPQRRQPRQQ